MTRSRSEIEAETTERRRALQESIDTLRGRLAPSAIAHDVTSSVSDRISLASAAVSEKAATPGGLIALCGMSFATAFAMGGGLRGRSASVSAVSSSDHLPPPSPEMRRIPRKDTLTMLTQGAAAVAAGAVLSRFIPSTETERQIFSGVGPELQRIVRERVEEQARRLAAPATPGFNVFNLAAILASVVLTRKRAGSSAV